MTDPHAAFRGGAIDPGRRLALVHGNCQAESLRVVLEGESLATVRMPPVHELTAGDLPHLRRWAQRAAVLVSQPVRRGYRGLPIGTADVMAMTPTRCATVIVPIVRSAGLYPEHAIIRPPGDPGAVPPVVPYHSLPVLAEAAGVSMARRRVASVAAVRRIAEASQAELRRREHHHGTVVVSDLLDRPHFGLMRTLNHPGNPVWLELAARVRDRLAITEPVADPGRPLLDAVHGPRLAAVIEAFELDDAPRAAWTVQGRVIDVEQVRDAHLRWYRARPEAVSAGLERHRASLVALGLT